MSAVDSTSVFCVDWIAAVGLTVTSGRLNVIPVAGIATRDQLFMVGVNARYRSPTSHDPLGGDEAGGVGTGHGGVERTEVPVLLFAFDVASYDVGDEITERSDVGLGGLRRWGDPGDRCRAGHSSDRGLHWGRFGGGGGCRRLFGGGELFGFHWCFLLGL